MLLGKRSRGVLLALGLSLFALRRRDALHRGIDGRGSLGRRLRAAVNHAVPAANSERPPTRMYLPPTRSAMRPASGATSIDSTEDGASTSPAFSAE